MRPFAGIHGKLSTTDTVYFRHRGGKVFGVVLKNPRTKFSDKEKAVRQSFGAISKRASEIAKDPNQAAQYLPAYEAQKAKGQKSLYQFIVTQLLRQQNSDTSDNQPESSPQTQTTIQPSSQSAQTAQASSTSPERKISVI